MLQTRVLVVESHADTLTVMGWHLSSRGAEVTKVASLEAAMDVLVAKFVHMVITSLTLPDGDGLELAIVAKFEHGCKTIVLTGHKVPDSGPPKGVDMWLVKPVHPDHLKTVIQELARQ